VLELLSSEYPVETTLWLPHQLAHADSLNGEVTLALLPGLYTITPATAGADEIAIAKTKRTILFMTSVDSFTSA
jgi:hypothetical protein